MSRENPWTKHRQSFWQEKSGRPSLPLWLRITALAYGVHRRNGHAPFKTGEIALATSVVDQETGEIRTPNRNRISEAIRQAVEIGFLHRDSHARCLVVPPWGIEGGMLGSPAEACKHHRASGNTGTTAENLPEIAERDSGNTGIPKPVTCTDVPRLYDSSNRTLPAEPDPAENPLSRRAAS